MRGSAAARLHWAVATRSQIGAAVQGGWPAAAVKPVHRLSALAAAVHRRAPLCRPLLCCCLQMAVKADYWDCTVTVSACCAKLREGMTSADFTGDQLTLLLTLLCAVCMYCHCFFLALLLFTAVAVLCLHLCSCYAS